jgi:hypothetical protein
VFVGWPFVLLADIESAAESAWLFRCRAGHPIEVLSELRPCGFDRPQPSRQRLESGIPFPALDHPHVIPRQVGSKPEVFLGQCGAYAISPQDGGDVLSSRYAFHTRNTNPDNYCGLPTIVGMLAPSASYSGV